MVGKPWNYRDYHYVYRNYPKESLESISCELGRSPVTVKAKALKLGVKACGPFTDEEKKLARTYGKALGSALMFLLPHRTSYEIEELLQCVQST